MSGLKNSPFGKRLRASQQDPNDELDAQHRRNRPKFNPIFGPASSSPSSSTTTLCSTPMDTTTISRPSTSGSSSGGGTSTGGGGGMESSLSSGDPFPSSAISAKLGGASSSTPSRSTATPQRNYGDRFVPSRDGGDLRTSYHLMEQGGPSTPNKTRIIPTESDALKEQANAIFNSILHNEVTPPSPRRPVSPARTAPIGGPHASSSHPPTTPTRRRLFTYNSPSIASNPNTPNRRLDAPTDEVYSMSPVRAQSRQLLESPRRQLRSVCKTPYRVLDAPDLADDFYLNLVDWSSTNVLAVGLGSCVYLWTAHTAAVSKLCDLASSTTSTTGGTTPSTHHHHGDTVSSVSWVQKGSSLAVATLSGRLQIYDATTLQLTRTYANAHTQRIGALAWNSHVLSSGSRDRSVHHRDVRDSNPRPFKRCTGHRQEVCGLKWSGDGGPNAATLASGGNDNKVCIWDLRGSRRGGGLGGVGAGHAHSSTPMSAMGGTPAGAEGGDEGPGDPPLWKFHEHTAAVKALAWDPHIAGVLATGGGTQDKHIRFWNVLSGSMLSELDTGSQVCNLVWSLTSHELVSTHGFSSTTAQNQICIWKYPTLNMVASLTGHTNRVLYLAMSPDGETIVTGAGDETLRFWNAFPKRGDLGRSAGESRLDYGRLIR